MKYIKLVLFFSWFLTIGISIHGQQANNTPFFYHTIEKGQNLTSIATMYGVTTYEIISMNPNAEKVIKIGEKLKIPQKSLTKNDVIYHTIQQGETLYRIMNQYHISNKAICDANPGLSADNFKSGQVIIIPVDSVKKQVIPQIPATTVAGNGSKSKDVMKSNCRDMHKVERKETLFSISRLYGLSEKELLDANPDVAANEGKVKKGHFICIPYPRKKEERKVEQGIPKDNDLFLKNENEVKQYKTVNVAVMLPFMLDEVSATAESKRMLDYYEGFLLAVDSLKKQGHSYQVFTYDCGDSNYNIENILSKPEMKSMQIIFGPTSNNQIKLVSAYSKKNKIKMVIPFTSKDTEVFNNPYIYQINTPQSYLYSEAYDCFTKKFAKTNVIFIDVYKNADKADFIKGLKEELTKANIHFRTVSINVTKEQMAEALKANSYNIFIPTSGEYAETSKTVKLLEAVIKENPTHNIALFGYPEYQAQSRLYPKFHELNTFIYTSFFVNTNSYHYSMFNKQMEKWYKRQQIRSIPRFGMLGFDTGYYFLKGLSLYGNQSEKQINNMNISPYQSFFHFERVNNWGGFINKKVVFVNFKRNKTININEF